jgi:uncharacterized protein YlxP (DUF503 family)
MRIGILTVEVFISDSNSLKDKRTVMKALKDRIRNNFNVSVAEVDADEKWQRGALAVAAVANDGKYLNGMLDRVLDLIRGDRRVDIIDCEIEFV